MKETKSKTQKGKGGVSAAANQISESPVFVSPPGPGAKTSAASVSSPPATPPSTVPPAWNNPNLVIRTRRAAIHSPVAVSGGQVIHQRPLSATSTSSASPNATVTITQPQIGLVRTAGGVIQSGTRVIPPGLVRFVSPGAPVMALNRLRPTVSLTGNRFISNQPQVVQTGSLVRMPDGTTAVVGQITPTGSPVNLLNKSGSSPVNANAIPKSLPTALNVINAQVPKSSVSLVNAKSVAGALTAITGQGMSVLNAAPRSVAGLNLVNAAGAVKGIAAPVNILNTNQGKAVVGAGQVNLLNATKALGGMNILNAQGTQLISPVSAGNLLTAQTLNRPGAPLLVSGAAPRAILASNLARARVASPSLVTRPATGVRTVHLGAAGLASPLGLRGVGVGAVPMGVNLVKASAAGGTGAVQIPMVGGASPLATSLVGGANSLVGGATQGLALRAGQLIQSSQNQSFVLITPRAQAPPVVTATSSVISPPTPSPSTPSVNGDKS